MKREIKKEDSTLKMLRKSRGMDAKEVAEKMGVAWYAVSHWENGHARTITQEQAEKYAEVLGVPVELIAYELTIKGGAKTPNYPTPPMPKTAPAKEAEQMTVEDVLRNTAPEDADPDFMKELKDGLKAAAVPSSVRCADTFPSGKARENGWIDANEEKPHGRCVVATKSGRVSYMREEDEIMLWIPMPEVPHEN